MQGKLGSVFPTALHRETRGSLEVLRCVQTGDFGGDIDLVRATDIYSNSDWYVIDVI